MTPENHYDLRGGRRGDVLRRESYRGTEAGALDRARGMLRESVREAAECQVREPEIAHVDVLLFQCGPDESAGWSHTPVATVTRRGVARRPWAAGGGARP